MTATRKERRTRRDRGAAALEFALIAPLFFFVIFGGVEMGMMFRSNLTIQDVSRNAARAASIERNNPDADRVILDRILNRGNALNGQVTKIIIYEASSLAATVPAACVNSGSQTSPVKCNVYEPGNPHDIAAIVAGGTLETGYDPADRTELKNVGIYIEYEYQYVTGFFDTTTLRANSVEVVELNL